MKSMSAKEVETSLNDGEKLNIIDVREVDEVATGKIPGTINIPLGLIEFRMHELDKSSEYIIVCRSGARSSLAVQVLEGNGYNAINMAGGMNSWTGKVA